MWKSKWVVFLILLALLSWWLADYTEVDQTIERPVPPHSPVIFSKGYNRIVMDDQGYPDTELVAEEMTNYSDDNSMEMKEPVMTFYSRTAAPWIVRSDTGWLSGDRKDLYLNGKVFLDREGFSGSRPIKVKTSNVKVKPEQNFAETDEWAELITPTDKVSGTGMKVMFKEPVFLELLSNVRSRYD